MTQSQWNEEDEPVFIDERTEEPWYLKYIDDEVAVLRNATDREHRFQRRESFDKNVTSSEVADARFTYTGETLDEYEVEESDASDDGDDEPSQGEDCMALTSLDERCSYPQKDGQRLCGRHQNMADEGRELELVNGEVLNGDDTDEHDESEESTDENDETDEEDETGETEENEDEDWSEMIEDL